jgi:hypothetical protein
MEPEQLGKNRQFDNGELYREGNGMSKSPV